MPPRTHLVTLAVSAGLFLPAAAHAWGIGSQLDHAGCHERITAQAFRNARAMFPSAAPRIAPTKNEDALIDEVQFVPPSDFVHDFAAMSLLLGVRDNDLKGENPLDSLRLTEVHGNPLTQQEHCIRSATDDGSAGDESALAACRAFIVMRATEALDALTADGIVDANDRMKMAIYISFAGHVDPELPRFYVKMGQGIHALEDGFTHTYRTGDGAKVTVVTNWIDGTDGTTNNEERDGPPHLTAMDHCDLQDPLVQRNYALSIEAGTALLAAALDPLLTREQKVAQFEAITTKYLSYQPGCTKANEWCDAAEEKVVDSGCSSTGARGNRPWTSVALIAAVAWLATRRRGRHAAAGAGLGLVGLLAAPVHAQTPTKNKPAPAPAPAPSPEPTPAPAPGWVPTADPNAPAPPPDAPAVPVTPEKAQDLKDIKNGEEPGRDVSTPTVAEVKSVRDDKRLGSRYGFAATIGGSFIHGAGVVAIAGRFRLNEKWVFGVDAEWNPWVTPQPLEPKMGVLNIYGTVIRRFPMKFDRVNLRTTLHLGVSRLLFDVYGAPKGSMGPYAAFTPLGIDYDLGHAWRIVIDPVEIAVPVPHLGLIPLFYEQFRLMVGIQVGA